MRQDTPGFTFTATLVRDWEKYNVPELNPQLRCVLFPINWKSNFAAADEGVNFRTDHSHKIKKGDMIVREDGEIYILNWAVHNQVNNQPSQAKRCNLLITIKRRAEEEVDEEGYAISPAEEVDEDGYAILPEISEDEEEVSGEEIGGPSEEADIFLNKMPACIYQYDGRPDYQAAYNSPGVVSDVLTIVDLQWNSKTSKILVNDEFFWGTSLYRVININMSGVNIAHDAGLLQLHLRKVAGGERVD